MKQLWWKIKMYLFTLLSTWLTPMNNIITLHKFKVITSINCLWPIGQVHLQISGLLRWLSGKETVCQCKKCRRHGFSPWVEKIPWSWKWQPTPGFMPGLKFQYFGHLMWRADSLEKTLMVGKIEGRRRGWWRINGWMASLTQRTWVWINSRSWWWTGRPGMLQSMGSPRTGHDWATELN